jgi:hypothetical protein
MADHRLLRWWAEQAIDFVTLCLGGFWSGALLRGDHGGGGPALLDVVAGWGDLFGRTGYREGLRAARRIE